MVIAGPGLVWLAEVRRMRRKGDFNTGKFWRWFASEAHGLANGIEALARGEADAEWLTIGLNERIRRYDASLEADIRRDLDGNNQLVVWGENAASIAGLLAAAPKIVGWRASTPVSADAPSSDKRRVPFRLAPQPSLERATHIMGLHDAWCFEAPVLVH
jgi:hypothetical protein